MKVEIWTFQILLLFTNSYEQVKVFVLVLTEGPDLCQAQNTKPKFCQEPFPKLDFSAGPWIMETVETCPFKAWKIRLQTIFTIW